MIVSKSNVKIYSGDMQYTHENKGRRQHQIQGVQEKPTNPIVKISIE